MSGRGVAAAVVAAAAVILGAVAWRVDAPAPGGSTGPGAASGAGANALPPPGPAPSAAAPPAGATGRSDPAALAFAAGTPRDRWVDPATVSPGELEARRRARLEHARAARAAYEQHPPFSRPLRENEDLLVPEQVPATERPLAGPGRGAGEPHPRVVVRQTQDRVFLRPGTIAAVGLEATVDGRSVPVEVRSAVLLRSSGSPPVTEEVKSTVAFAEAGGGRAASFAAPADVLGSFTGDLLLRVEAEAGGERGSLVYAFVYTGEPPAVFTGRARDRLERGSVVFEAGVDVRRPGGYRITGRVDDGEGKPLALARFDGELGAGALDVPLVLFGKIARDEGGIAPFVLRDVEGFRLLDGVYPDRETMATWAGPYRSRAYRAAELSADPWTGGDSPEATPRAR